MLFNIFILFTILIVLMLLGIPIAFSMGLAGIAGILLFMGPAQLNQITTVLFNDGLSGSLLVAPLFILMAEILIITGIAKDLFDCAYKWFSRIPGSLAITSIIASAGFSSVSGSSAATVVAVGGISGPEMFKRDYSRKLGSGAIVAGGTLGILIPPSVAMIIYGIITETSIVDLFIASIIPGVLVTFALSLMVFIYVIIVPSAAPKGEKFSWKARFESLIKVLPFVVLSLTILLSMYTGVATPTEAAGIGVVIALIIVLVMRRVSWSKLKIALANSSKTSAMIIFLVFGGSIFSFVVGYLGMANVIIDFISQFELNRWAVLTMVLIILLFFGMFMDPISVLVLTMPVVFPVMMELGYHPVWFGVIVIIAAEIGMITPPVGINLFVLKGKMPQLDLVHDIVKGALPFVLMMIFVIIILSIFPGIVTILI